MATNTTKESVENDFVSRACEVYLNPNSTSEEIEGFIDEFLQSKFRQLGITANELTFYEYLKAVKEYYSKHGSYFREGDILFQEAMSGVITPLLKDVKYPPPSKEQNDIRFNNVLHAYHFTEALSVGIFGDLDPEWWGLCWEISYNNISAIVRNDNANGELFSSPGKEFLVTSKNIHGAITTRSISPLTEANILAYTNNGLRKNLSFSSFDKVSYDTYHGSTALMPSVVLIDHDTGEEYVVSLYNTFWYRSKEEAEMYYEFFRVTLNCIMDAKPRTIREKKLSRNMSKIDRAYKNIQTSFISSFFGPDFEKGEYVKINEERLKKYFGEKEFLRLSRKFSSKSGLEETKKILDFSRADADIDAVEVFTALYFNEFFKEKVFRVNNFFGKSLKDFTTRISPRNIDGVIAMLSPLFDLATEQEWKEQEQLTKKLKKARDYIYEISRTANEEQESINRLWTTLVAKGKMNDRRFKKMMENPMTLLQDIEEKREAVIGELIRDKRIESAIWDDKNALIVKTDDLFITDVFFRNISIMEKVFPEGPLNIGKWTLTIPEVGAPFLKKLEDSPDFSETHPHMTGPTSMCFGNMSDKIFQHQKKGDLHEVVMIMLEILQNIHANDVANRIENFYYGFNVGRLLSAADEIRSDSA